MARRAVLLPLILITVSSAHAQDAHAQDAALVPAAVISCTTLPATAAADPATTASVRSGPFRADQHFRESIATDAEVSIAWLGDTFRRRFVPLSEAAAEGAKLRVVSLQRPMRADDIVMQLGLRKEATLAALWCLLRRQPRGEAGPLSTDAAANLMFMRDGAGALWAVDVVWGGAGWEIGASATDADRPWPAGTRVIGRASE